MAKVKGRLGRPQTLAVAKESEVDQQMARVFLHFDQSQTDAAVELEISQPQFRYLLVKENKESIPLELAVKIDAATKGLISFESLNPKFGKLLSEINNQRAKKRCKTTK